MMGSKMFRMHRGNDRSASMVIVAMALVPLLVVVALVVDVGQKRQLEAAAQGAIDAAALAATYHVRYVQNGDLDHAADVAKEKVAQGFWLPDGAWDNCLDPDHLSSLPPGHNGECISFVQRPDRTGAMVWFVRIKLPERKFRTLFARVFGVDSLDVVSQGGADGGNGGAAPTMTTIVTTTTASPETICRNELWSANWTAVMNLAAQQIADYVAANPGVELVGWWWDGSDGYQPMPDLTNAPVVDLPDSCAGIVNVDISLSQQWWGQYWGTAWVNSCLNQYLSELGWNANLIPTGACSFGIQYAGWPPTTAPVPTTLPQPTTTVFVPTTRDITLG